jgi:hypothetical protein
VGVVSSVWAESARLPSAVVSRAVRLAREYRRAVVTDDLFLLALTELDESQPARRALAAVGVSSERLLPQIRTAGDDAGRGSAGGMLFSPAYYTLQGLAQGFAAALGDGVISAEHVLLAILWSGNSRSLPLLRHLDVTREAIVAALAELGVPVPRAELPALIEVEWGEPVWFDRDQTKQVLDHVRLNLDPGTRWGFNYDGDRARVHAERSVDLATLVREALDDEQLPAAQEAWECAVAELRERTTRPASRRPPRQHPLPPMLHDPDLSSVSVLSEREAGDHHAVALAVNDSEGTPYLVIGEYVRDPDGDRGWRMCSGFEAPDRVIPGKPDPWASFGACVSGGHFFGGGRVQSTSTNDVARVRLVWDDGYTVADELQDGVALLFGARDALDRATVEFLDPAGRLIGSHTVFVDEL